MSDSLWPYGLQHTRLPCPSPTPRACSNSYPKLMSIKSVMPSNHLILCYPLLLLSLFPYTTLFRSHPSISSSVIPFSCCLQLFPASGSFPMSWLFTSGGQSVGASAVASVLLIYIQGWFPLGLTDLISLLSKGLSRLFSNNTVQKHQFFSTQLSL